MSRERVGNYLRLSPFPIYIVSFLTLVVIDAFRLINPQSQMIGQESRQTTSNIGHLNKPNIQVSSSSLTQALIHGLNRHYYSIAINYRKNELEQKMLLNLHKKTWTSGLNLQDFGTFSHDNEVAVEKMLKYTKEYNASIQEETKLSGNSYTI